jgi:predicted ATP-grasp superfamily ATP-dependent carboligase
MRVLVHEHLCSLPAKRSSLRAEGQAMLCAVLADLAACADVQPVTLVEPSLVGVMQAVAPGAEVYPVGVDGVEPLFRRLAREVMFSLVIAPEFDDLLATRCEWALEEGCRLLGPSPEAVRLCSDKLRLAEHLREHGVSTPATTLYSPDIEVVALPAVCKLRHGAGAQAVFVVAHLADLHDAAARIRRKRFRGDLIVQPCALGRHASVSVLLGPGQRLALAPAEQSLLSFSTGRVGQFQLRYTGGEVPLPDAQQGRRGAALAERGVAVVPGLSGYVGVDLVLGAEESGHDDRLIEINPRLTTSYVGLRRLARVNLMQTLLDVVRGKLVALTWHKDTIRFDAEGTIH